LGSTDRRRIGRALARLLGPQKRLRPSPEPACEFGLVVDERLKDLQADVVAIKRLLVAVLLAVIGGVVGLVAELLGAI
jgi:hypothetical protein